MGYRKSTMKHLLTILLRRVFQTKFGIVLAAAIVSSTTPAGAATKTWNGGVLWSDSSSWSPSGAPTTNDDVVASVPNVLLLDVASAPINSLEIRSGANLATNGSFLLVQSPSGAGTIQLDGSASQLIVNPRPISVFNAVNTHNLNLSGSTLAMAGGVAAVRTRLSNTSGTIRGHGTVLLQGATAPNLINTNGDVIAEGGHLVLRATQAAGRFDLDGIGNEATPQLIALDGSSTLQIDGLLTDPFDGRLILGAGNTIAFCKAAELSNNSFVFFEGTGGPATIGGPFGSGKLTSGAVMNVSTGVVVIDQDEIEFTPSSLITVAGGAELSLRSNSTHAGNLSLVGGELSGAGTLTNSGVINGRGLISSGDLVNDGLIWAQNGTLTIDTQQNFPNIDGALNTGVLRATGGGTLEVLYPSSIVGFAGGIDANGGTFAVADNVGLLLNSGGTVRLTSGGRLQVGAYTQSSGSTLTVSGVVTSHIDAATQISLGGENTINGPLELNGQIFVNATAAFAGSGNLIISDGSRLGGETGAFVNIPIFNEGLVAPGTFGNNSAARLDFNSFTNSSVGTLALELGGLIPGTEHDQIGADTFIADGTLEVTLFSGYTPMPGDSYQLLTFDVLSGSFDSVLLPASVNWDTSQLLTNGLIAVLSGFSADFDNDGDVDSDDLTQWQVDFGVNGGSDADADNDSDGTDFLAWQRQLGIGASPLAVSRSVPEPSSLTLSLAVATIGCATQRRRWTHQNRYQAGNVGV